MMAGTAATVGLSDQELRMLASLLAGAYAQIWDLPDDLAATFDAMNDAQREIAGANVGQLLLRVAAIIEEHTPEPDR